MQGITFKITSTSKQVTITPSSLTAHSANKKKSLSAIYLAPIEHDTKNAKDVRGHDVMAAVEGFVARRFPIYPEDAANTERTGRTRQLQYKLMAVEAGWVLKTGSGCRMLNFTLLPTLFNS